MTGTITVEGAKINNSYSVEATYVTGTSFKNAESAGTNYYHEADFVGATGASFSAEWANDEIEAYNSLLDKVRLGAEGFEKYGDKDTFPTNLKALRNDYPEFFNNDVTYEKFYFSDNPEAMLSQKFANYYFDIRADSDIQESDYCNARIFDDHKSLYVEGYIKCLPTTIENINLYDLSEADKGEPC